MPTGPQIILVLKCAVIAVTILLVGSLVALSRGNFRLHGRINILFFILTLLTVIGLEVLVQASDRQLFDYLLDQPEMRWRLQVHLSFSLPATVVMPVMLYTGLTHRRQVHLFLAGAFTVLWIGTVVTGVFFLE